MLLLGLASFWCGILIFGRIFWTAKLGYGFLAFNLVLAGIPLCFSTLMQFQKSRALRILTGVAWLLFFPNAPYIITDFVHLKSRMEAPLWFDVLLLASCSATGLALGYASMLQIHDALSRAGRHVLGWLVVGCSSFLAGFGIYLGRFLRWHSIDIIRNPVELALDIGHRLIFPWQHPRTWGVTLGFGVLLLLGYLFVTILRSRNSQDTSV